MKRVHGVLAAVAALAFATGVATACDGEKSAQKVSATKAASCASVKAASTTASSCSAAKTASTAASCASMKSAGLTASACNTKSAGLTAAACAAKCATAKACATTHVVYRVGETETFDRAEAFAMAEKSGTPVTFVAAGTAYDEETAAKGAMTQAIYTRLDEMLAVSTTVGGKAYACGASAAKAAEAGSSEMRFVVAGHEFASKDAAEAYLAKAREAVEAIMLIDAEGKPVKGCAVGHCKTNGKTAFKLGNETIEDPVSANYAAAQAKLAAILSMDA